MPIDKRYNLNGHTFPAARCETCTIGEALGTDGLCGVALEFDNLTVQPIITVEMAKNLHKALGVLLRDMQDPGRN